MLARLFVLNRLTHRTSKQSASSRDGGGERETSFLSVHNLEHQLPEVGLTFLWPLKCASSLQQHTDISCMPPVMTVRLRVCSLQLAKGSLCQDLLCEYLCDLLMVRLCISVRRNLPAGSEMTYLPYLLDSYCISRSNALCRIDQSKVNDGVGRVAPKLD